MSCAKREIIADGEQHVILLSGVRSNHDLNCFQRLGDKLTPSPDLGDAPCRLLSANPRSCADDVRISQKPLGEHFYESGSSLCIDWCKYLNTNASCRKPGFQEGAVNCVAD